MPFEEDFRTVIDVGASRGQFALFASRRFAEARIVSFEPLPGPAAKLEEVLGTRVDVRRTAVGSRPGRATVHVSRSDDSSSLLPIGSRQVEEFPGTGEAGSHAAETTTLDLAFAEPPERPCLLKIDVQGFELEVLRGAERTLGDVDEALVECSFIELYEGQPLADQIIAFMLEQGLRLKGVHGLSRSTGGEQIQADFHFRREVSVP